ncbi:hypothetical protein UXB74_25335, partial [Escherichia marmotae]|nr:hypothetical protein [Escherichia marmotae]
SLSIPVNCPYTLGIPEIRLTGNKATKANSIKTNKYDTEKLVIYFKQGKAFGQGADISLNSYNKLTNTSVTGFSWHWA